MGRLVLQELAISFELLLELLKQMEAEIYKEETSAARRRELIIAGAAFSTLYTGGLREGEVLLMEASALVSRGRDGKESNKQSHVAVPLMGRFKGETGERNVMLALANTSKGGLKIRIWLERLMEVLRREGKDRSLGPAICEEDGEGMERRKLNRILHEFINVARSIRPELLKEEVVVEERFSIHRSFRRGSTTRAKEQGIEKSVLDMNNRWRKFERRSGGLPNLPMADLYVDISQAIVSRTKYSRAL